jgi:threonine aldolase
LAAHVNHYTHIRSVIEPETNIVVFYLEDDITPQAYCEKLKEKGVLAIPFGAGRIRMVTHLNIDDTAIEKAVEAMKSI